MSQASLYSERTYHPNDHCEQTQCRENCQTTKTIEACTRLAKNASSSMAMFNRGLQRCATLPARLRTVVDTCPSHDRRLSSPNALAPVRVRMSLCETVLYEATKDHQGRL